MARGKNVSPSGRARSISARWPLTPRQRFDCNVKCGKPNECWPWTGCRNRAGYGTIKIGQRHWLASRLQWTWVHGEIPEGMCVLHHCDNPACVNPAHLWLGTRIDNIRDMDAKKRRLPGKGERQHLAKLTGPKVKEVRRLYSEGWTYRRIAREMNVDPSTIARAVNRETWKHIE